MLWVFRKKELEENDENIMQDAVLCLIRGYRV